MEEEEVKSLFKQPSVMTRDDHFIALQTSMNQPQIGADIGPDMVQ